MNTTSTLSRLRRGTILVIGTATFFVLAPLAQAHPGHVEANGLASGFAHPFSGLDHLLAMVAVGLWSAQMGGKAVWRVPLAFVGCMLVGSFLGMSHISMPLVEPGILASIFVLGVLVAAAARLPLAASMAIVGSFALFHGFAHGAEVAVTASGLTYGLGFTLATVALHALGVGVALMAARLASAQWIRYAGFAVVLGGLVAWLG